jgi:importin subunit beta-1
MLQGAVELLVVLNQNDEDIVDYDNQFRRGMFESYSGILQGIKGAKAQLMIPYAGHLLQFTEAVYKDSSRCTSFLFPHLLRWRSVLFLNKMCMCFTSRDESVTKAAVAVLGDLADTLGPISKDLFKSHLFHVEFLRECVDSDDEVRDTASWADKPSNSSFLA